MDHSNHQAFYRPTTRFNRVLDAVFSSCDPLHYIDESTLIKWQGNSLDLFRDIVDDRRVLDRVVEDAFWSLSEDRPPENTWFGEAKFDGKERPQVIIYEDSITTRLPSELLFDLAGQSGTDHIFGHLYAFYSGQNDYGEGVACRYQFFAARERGGMTWSSFAALVPVLHRLHKNIPLGNYSKVPPKKE